MLKRTLCAAFAVAVLVAFSVPAFAGSHHKMRVRGTVESVDPAQKTFVVKDRDGKAIPFRVDDRSEFELEHRDKPDQDVPFTELKTGDRVKVKAFKGEPPHLVDDVDIYRYIRFRQLMPQGGKNAVSFPLALSSPFQPSHTEHAAKRNPRCAACCFKHTGSTESMQEKFPEKSQKR